MKTKSTLQKDRLTGFKPVADPHSRILILGSMPGVRSLQDQEYFAHPRNAFWKIIEALFGILAVENYAARCAGLLDSNIAIWDTLRSCHREGSLDSDIHPDSEVANNFRDLFERSPEITDVFFNGAKAESAFNKHVRNALLDQFPEMRFARLPSTSPAHASMTFEQKLASWAVIKEALV